MNRSLLSATLAQSSMIHALAAIEAHNATVPEGSPVVVIGESVKMPALTTLIEYQEPPVFICKPETQENLIPQKAMLNRTTAQILAVTAMLAGAGGFTPGFSARNPAAQHRNDPSRPKTDEDMARMEAAELKRRRKAERKAATKKP